MCDWYISKQHEVQKFISEDFHSANVTDEIVYMSHGGCQRQFHMMICYFEFDH